MSDYTKLTDFASKDALPSGNANKIVKGTEIDDEFEAIETAIATKANIASPTFTGTPAAPTAATGVDTTQIATTAFVQQEITANAFNVADGSITTAKLAADAVTGAKIADDAVDTEHLAADAVDAAAIADNVVGAAALNVSGNGTSGQLLQSDGDGSFSWIAQSAVVEKVTAAGDWDATANDGNYAGENLTTVADGQSIVILIDAIGYSGTIRRKSGSYPSTHTDGTSLGSSTVMYNNDTGSTQYISIRWRGGSSSGDSSTTKGWWIKF